MNNGNGEMTARLYQDETIKIITCRIHSGRSIGYHKHDTSDNINYVLSGQGKVICDGVEGILYSGTCHIFKKGFSHSIENTEDIDFILLTIVVEK